MDKIKHFILGLIIIIFTGVSCYGLLLFLNELRIFFTDKLQTITSTEASILVGLATAWGVIATTWINNKHNRRAAKEESVRKDKIKLYEYIIKESYSLFDKSISDEEKQKNAFSFVERTRKDITIWGSDKVILAYAEWYEEIIANSDNQRAQALIKMADLFKAIRKDLGYSNKGLEIKSFLGLLLENYSVFEQEYKKNNDVTLAEIGKKEEEHKAAIQILVNRVDELKKMDK